MLLLRQSLMDVRGLYKIAWSRWNDLQGLGCQPKVASRAVCWLLSRGDSVAESLT